MIFKFILYKYVIIFEFIYKFDLKIIYQLKFLNDIIKIKNLNI